MMWARWDGASPKPFLTAPEGGFFYVGEAFLCAGTIRWDERAAAAHALGLPRNAADGELVSAAFERWRDEAPFHILGDFALAVFDVRRRRLTLARDVFGVHPMYWTAGGDLGIPEVLAAGSRADALARLDGREARLDEVRAAHHLAGWSVDATRTFFRDVKRVPRAHTISWDGHTLQQREYWRLNVAPRRSPERALGELRARFERAVACRVSGETAVTLSGGLDSTAVACAARRLAPVSAHALVFPGLSSDESRYIGIVERECGIDATRIDGTKLNPWHALERATVTQSEPVGAPNLFLHEALYESARRSGATVLLDGLDGDTTLSHGMERLVVLAQRGRWLRLLSETRSFSRRHGITMRRTLRRHVWSRWRRRRGPRSILDEDVAQRVAFESTTRAHLSSLRGLRTEQELHRANLERGILSHALELAHHAAHARGIEPRYPFFDRRLAQFCVSLPATWKLRDGWSRWAHREASAGLMPDEIRWRVRKARLGPQFTQCMRGLVRDEHAIEHRLQRVLPLVDRARLNDYRDRLLHAADLASAVVVWRALTLDVWMEQWNISA